MTVDPHKRVLVVDDDEGVRDLLSAVLRMRGLTVDVASGGNEALDLIALNTYSVVLLDLLMPNVDGFAVLGRLHAGDNGSAPVVLVVTGAERPAIAQLDAQHIHGIVKKPFDPEELANIVVACADIRGRNALGTMAIAAVMAGSPLLALLNRWT
jgi:CheY-like chemotaxis protein